jgi:hypothetical protein
MSSHKKLIGAAWRSDSSVDTAASSGFKFRSLKLPPSLNPIPDGGKMKPRLILLLLGGRFGVSVVHAETARDFLNRFETEARASAPAFAASATRGEKFFHTAGAKDWRCSTCHTDNPAGLGKHATTSKPIEPLVPAVNTGGFVRTDKVDKWRARCRALGRCTGFLGVFAERGGAERRSWIAGVNATSLITVMSGASNEKSIATTIDRVNRAAR